MTMFGSFLKQKFPQFVWYGGTILVFIILLVISIIAILDWTKVI